MATFHIENFGCRATQADAAAIEQQLLARGYVRSATSETADVVVVNTCTVTASADAQARQAIRAIHSTNPAAHVIATGCYAQRAPEELAALEGVRWVVGNSHQTEIASLLGAASDSSFVPLARVETEPMSLARGPAKILTGNIFEQTDVLVAPVDGGEAGHTRPILKIQDGCNNRCSYCVIPFVRGRSRSLKPTRVIEEVRRLATAGYREIVLSGINLGTYGRDLTPRVALGDLLRVLLDETPIERLRLSSMEPMDVTQDLVDLFASSDRLAHHFHIPLQSGSDRILAAMRRWYRAEHYARRVELIRERLPEAGIGADVIAGFPGETEEDHAATMALIEQLQLTYLHVFSFSKRPGTTVAELCGEVAPATIKRRSRELRALGSRKQAAFLEAQVGKTLRVLTLRRSGTDDRGPWTGAIAGNYLSVRVEGSWPANQMLEVQTIHAMDTYLASSASAIVRLP